MNKIRAAAVPAILAVLTLGWPVPALAGAPSQSKPKAPELKVTIAQEPNPVRPGQSTGVSVQLQPPEGIKLNQYPGITLKVTGRDGLTLDSAEAFIGTKTPIEDPAKFGFKTIDPLRLNVTVPAGTRGTRTLEGSLTYYYCVVASGYCAPAETTVRIPIKIAS